MSRIITKLIARSIKWLRDNRAGMTLLELLVVMVILGLLATLGSVQLTRYLGRARTDTAQLQIQELATALDLFHMDSGRFPTTSEGLVSLVEKPKQTSLWNGPYLRSRAILLDPWRRPYRYQSPGTHGEYDLFSLGADGQTGGDNENRDVVSWDD